MPYPTEFRNATLIKMNSLNRQIINRVLGQLDLLGTREEVEVAKELTHKAFLYWTLNRVIAAEQLAKFDILLDSVVGREI